MMPMPQTLQTPPPLQDGDLLAAIDLGSNSFHMVIARHLLGQLRVVDRLRETVRMADGLDARGGLSEAAAQRALDCLARFGQRIRDLPKVRVRALATNTVRKLQHPQDFLGPAEAALGHPIEVVSGREEARLIYLGVAHAQPPRVGQRRLVIDIGGGSTEFIIGSGFEPIERESLQAGCIASTRRFFPDGRLSRRRWRDALHAIGADFQSISSRYRALGWDEAVGSSGTHKSISEICTKMGLSKGAITAPALAQLRDALLQARHVDQIDLPGLSADRRPIIAGGVLVLEAAFRALDLQKLSVSKAAMREGILYDLLGRHGDNDLRDVSVQALSKRYDIDTAQAQRVHDTALHMFEQVADAWSLDPDDAQMLSWAARLHEIGLAIAHNGYHTHGAYLLEHSDIAGFSRQEQQMLAALVRGHRRHVGKHAFDALPERLLTPARRLTALLRLAVLLHRSHDPDPIAQLELHAEGNDLTLSLAPEHLATRPLLHADLLAEVESSASLGLRFQPLLD